MSGADVELHVKDGSIYWGDERVSIKGTNWFGFETVDFALHGLWMANMNGLLDFVAQHNFNAIRMPFSAELALNMDDRQPGNIDYSANPELQGLTTGQVVDRFVQECARRGLLVLLDMHRLAAAKDIPELWYDQEYPESAVLQAWKTMVLRYKPCWNVFAADLNNEPHGCASWGDDNIRTDWRLAAERIAAIILETNPKLLIFVEGVERNAIVQPGESCWWGGHFAAAAKAPVRIPCDKLVYSPHVYGPDVFGQPYFDHSDFPNNMPDIWRRHFGYIKQDCCGPAICPGEWGGWAKPGSKDELWQNTIAAWFIEHGIDCSFYWCLNPNSGDTGGLLQDDWKTPVEHKLDIISRAHPNPTKWPQDEVSPLAPESELCQVEAAVDPAACSGGAPAPAPAAAGDGGQVAAPVPVPAASMAPLTAGEVEVNDSGSWQEGSTPCYQLEVKVTNTSGAPASSMSLRVGACGELQKAWNCTQKEDADGCWCFDFPDWVAPSGGLAVGANVVVGLIVKGEQPTQFTLQ